MDASAWIVLVAGVVVLGLIGEFVFRGARYRFEWVATGIGALIGGYAASELLGSAGEWGPAIGGLFWVPALIGGIVVGGIVRIVPRNIRPAQAGRASG